MNLFKRGVAAEKSPLLAQTQAAVDQATSDLAELQKEAVAKRAAHAAHARRVDTRRQQTLAAAQAPHPELETARREAERLTEIGDEAGASAAYRRVVEAESTLNVDRETAARMLAQLEAIEAKLDREADAAEGAAEVAVKKLSQARGEALLLAADLKAEELVEILCDAPQAVGMYRDLGVPLGLSAAYRRQHNMSAPELIGNMQLGFRVARRAASK